MESEGSLPHSQESATYLCPRQLDPVQTPTHQFLKIQLNIILPCTQGSSKWSLSLRFPYQNPVYACPLTHTRYIPRPSHFSRSDQPNNIGWRVQIMYLIIISTVSTNMMHYLLSIYFSK